MIFWFDFCLFLMKVHLILMKLIEISWNFLFWILIKALILKHFEFRWNKWCPNQAWKKLVKHHNLVNVKTYLNLLKAFRIKNTGCFFCSPQIFVTRWYLKLIQIWLFLINLSNTKWWSERGWIFDSIHLLWNMIYLLIRWMNTSRVKYSIIGTDFLVYFCL